MVVFQQSTTAALDRRIHALRDYIQLSAARIFVKVMAGETNHEPKILLYSYG